MGFFDKIKQGLKKTLQTLNTDVRDLFKSEGRLVDDAFLKDLMGVLVKTDMGIQASQAIVDEINARFRTRVMHMDELLASAKPKLNDLLAQPECRSGLPCKGRP